MKFFKQVVIILPMTKNWSYFSLYESHLQYSNRYRYYYLSRIFKNCHIKEIDTFCIQMYWATFKIIKLVTIQLSLWWGCSRRFPSITNNFHDFSGLELHLHVFIISAHWHKPKLSFYKSFNTIYCKTNEINPVEYIFKSCFVFI